MRDRPLSPAGSVVPIHELIAKYDGRAPRYTSYPTATQFTPAVDAQVYSSWLARIPAAQPISLYIHIPFCDRLCWYCGCNMRVVHRPEPISAYVRYLRDELAMLEQILPPKAPVKSIHLGGGTPNMLSRDDLVLLFSTLRHVFAVRPGAEISVECDPANLTQSWMTAAAFHGVTRVSLGVQDLTPVVQQAVNRNETFDQIRDAVGYVRGAGIPSLNFDLMYGLPKQTAKGLLRTLDQVLSLEPDRIALFGYAHVPWLKANQGLIHDEDLPDPIERFEQADGAAERLIEAGYIRVGIDHFALPHDDLALRHAEQEVHRNFQGYTADACETLIGIGASAISRLAEGYAQNKTAEIAWRAALDEGVLPTARGMALTAEDRFRGDIIERLMCDLRVDLAEICHRHGRTLFDLIDERETLEAFTRDGLLSHTGEVIEITPLGLPFARAICAIFDTHLRAGGLHHARVV